MKKIVISIDSFKGCLSSTEAVRAAAEGVHSVYPECETVCLPVADGGEGILDMLISATNGSRVELFAHDPLMRLHKTSYGISEDGKTAYIEMASISGLTLVPPCRRDPMHTTTYGCGELIGDALNRGCDRFIIGIGGSATNDAGLGMLQALGYHLLDVDGNRIEEKGGSVLKKVRSIDGSSAHPALHASHFIIACDVKNPFYGVDGAARVFAPQKGATSLSVDELEAGMCHLAQIIQQSTGKDIAHIPGAGAAGGMGGCCLAFFNAELRPGIHLLLDIVRFKERIRGADFILTGEGKADKQTLMGKVPYGILQEAREQRIPVLLLAGKVEDAQELHLAGFQGVFSINSPRTSREQAMQPDFAYARIRSTVQDICLHLLKTKELPSR